MRRVVAVAVLLFAASLARPAAPTNPSVEEIVERHVEARGGLGKIRAITTLRQKGRAIAGANREALITRELKRPDRSRFEFTVQGVTAVYVSDGQRGWEVSPFAGDVAPRPLADDVVAEAAVQADIEGPLVDWKAKGHRVELVGREAVDGRDAYKLKLTLEGGAVRYDYIDVRSLMLVRTDSTRHVRGHAVAVETTFGGFKKKGGVLFPHDIEIGASGRPQRLRIVVEQLEVNPPLDDARFEISAQDGF